MNGKQATVGDNEQWQMATMATKAIAAMATMTTLTGDASINCYLAGA